MKLIFMALIIVFGWIILAGLQRRFASETLINGFMNKDKAADLALTIFKKDKMNDKVN